MSNFVDDSDNDDKASDEMGDIDYYRSEVGEEPEPGNVILLAHFITTTLPVVWYHLSGFSIYYVSCPSRLLKLF